MIRLLDESLINKIAAGEVVERPASVVKELCENSLDAGARNITVEIADGGLELIRVTDDGCGIPAGEAETAFMRHATSKLHDAEGLNAIMTLGFRGEALSSVAAVSITEIITKTADAETAVKLCIKGGLLTEKSEAAGPTGTAITVRDLFYNTPARRKFLKKPGTEGGYVADAVTKLAFSRPDAAVTFINNGSEVFSTKGGDLKTAALAILGRDAASKLIAVNYQRGLITVTGLTGKPELSRGNRGHGFFYINNRYIRNPIAQSAVEAAYKTRLMTGRFPVYILNQEIPPELVDVNVHPAKLEARFSRDVDVYRIMLGAVDSALKPGFAASVNIDFGRKAHKETQRKAQTEPPSEPLIVRETYKPPEFIPDFAKADDTGPPMTHPYAAETAAAYNNDTIKSSLPDLTYIYIPPVPLEAPVKQGIGEYRIIGQLLGTYWLIERMDGESCYLLDQHAAHERVIFEELNASLAQKGAVSQRMVEPVAVKLTSREKQTVADNMQLLVNMGFELEDMYDDNLAIRAVPYIFDSPADGGFFMEIIDKLCDEQEIGSPYDTRLDAVSRMACRAAVKANDRLSEREARALIERALESENPFTCPHGRPVIVELTRRDIEKMFKRIV
ncbi:MAG: DNA mismatch repair endonuclease MutL [Clostridiales bacterium]|nr:DNA mismatch repair endonuclease MutL [Clostridiales bacterium]